MEKLSDSTSSIIKPKNNSMFSSNYKIIILVFVILVIVSVIVYFVWRKYKKPTQSITKKKSKNIENYVDLGNIDENIAENMDENMDENMNENDIVDDNSIDLDDN